MNKKTQQLINILKKYKVPVIIVIVLLIIDLTFTGFLKFGYNVVRCEGVPVKVGLEGYTPFSAEYSHFYLMPGDYSVGGAGSKYYCTEQQAKDTGHSKGF